MYLYSFSISKASDAAQTVVSTECSSDYLDVSIRKKSMDVLSLSPFQFRFRISTLPLFPLLHHQELQMQMCIGSVADFFPLPVQQQPT